MDDSKKFIKIQIIKKVFYSIFIEFSPPALPNRTFTTETLRKTNTSKNYAFTLRCMYCNIKKHIPLLKKKFFREIVFSRKYFEDSRNFKISRNNFLENKHLRIEKLFREFTSLEKIFSI